MEHLLDELDTVLDAQWEVAKSSWLALTTGTTEETLPGLGFGLSGANKIQKRFFDWKSEKNSRITLPEIQKQYKEARTRVRQNRALLEFIAAGGTGPGRNYAVPLAAQETLDSESSEET